MNTMRPVRAAAWAVCVVAMATAPFAARAAGATPAGLWQTIDDHTDKPRSLVRIIESDGIYTGRIDKSLGPTTDPAAVCTECTDERRGQPLIGLVIIRRIVHSTSDPAVYDQGDITDPDNGKVYRARLKPVDDGRKLEVRGYIGPFYRTQTWIRVE